MRRAYKIVKIEYARPAFDLSNSIIECWMDEKEKFESMNTDGTGIITLSREELWDLVYTLEKENDNDTANAIREDLAQDGDSFDYAIF